MKRIGVLTSGGDAPGMNAAIRAVVRAALARDMTVVGFKRGYNGLLMRSADQSDDFELLTSRSVSDRIHRGGTFLRTARCLEFLDPEVRKAACGNVRALGIEGLICIGGDGTFKGAEGLHRLGLPTVGVPGTIDNDLSYTDYTIGFDTALNTACECLNHIRETGDSHERASLITVMGRNCGDIALHTALTCGAEICMIPEVKWDIEEVAARVRWGVLNGKRSMILIFAEGAQDSLTTDLARLYSEHESLSRLRLPADGKLTSSQLAAIIEELSGHETRSTVLGYIQRGGSPSARDRMIATQMGAHAVQLLSEDKAGLAVGIRGTKLIEVPFEDVQKGRHEADAGLIDLIDTMSTIPH